MAKNWSEWIRSGDWANEDQAKIPMLPAHVRELAELAFDPEVSVRRIAAAVAKDPVLAMQVIRMANSAASASATDITDLNDAVVRLGTQTVRNTVVAGCLNAQLVDPKVYGAHGRQIVDHSLGTALVASSLAKKSGTSGEMFLGGLLHDIGKLLILKLAHDVRVNSENGPMNDEVGAVLAERHAQMGGWLAARWSMPPALSDPIAWHHDPEWTEDYASATIIYSANRLAHRYGFGCEPDPSDILTDPVLAELGIDEMRLAALDAEAPALYNTTKHILRM
jgi:putative nucleotidyltransferase with HDIG domain